MTQVRKLLVSTLIAVGGCILVAPPTMGRVELSSPYSKAQTYSGALRYLRVDRGYEVVERDPDAAYLLFQFVPDGKSKSVRGSIEVIEVKTKVRVILRVPELPEYHEAMLRDGLVEKLKGEYGDPREGARPSRDGGAREEPTGEPDGEAGRDENQGEGGEAPPREAGEDGSDPRDNGDQTAPTGSGDQHRGSRRRPRKSRR
ncbi:MAG: hypothetical protein JW751_24065 [Polyangiaceae bacterium]|nr:hypothetical protein [Polyangiaceae bacterium]